MLDELAHLLVRELNTRGSVTVRCTGTSMLPLIPPNARIELEPCCAGQIKIGDILCYRSPHGQQGFVVHRLFGFHRRTGGLLLGGDWRGRLDRPVPAECLVGRVRRVLDLPFSLPVWNGLNRLYIAFVVGPVGWLHSRAWGRELLHRLKRWASVLSWARRVRLWIRLQLALRTNPPLQIGTASGVYCLRRGDAILGTVWVEQRPDGPFLTAYEGQPRPEWLWLLAQIRHDAFGLRPGKLRTGSWSEPEHSQWLDLLLSLGFTLRQDTLTLDF